MSHRAAWRGSFILVPGMPRLLQLLSAAFAVRGSLAAQASCPSPAARLENLTSFPAYDKTARPNVDLGTPVDVGVQLYLAAIPEVDQKKQQFAIEGYFRLDWTDNRLATTGDPCASTLILELPVSSVWQPDIYWDNSLAEWYGAGAMNIYEDGRIYRSVRYKQTLRCPMNFQRLPFDKQQCFALLGSYSWDLHNVNASAFSNGAIVVPEGYDGTTEWQLEEATYEVTTEWFGAGADRKGYKYIWVYFNLNRRPNSFLMFVVGTAILFVLVAWAGLFIDRKVAPARVTIAVIPVLIMLNLENSVTSRLPELNYLTWLTSFLFVMKLFGLSCVFEYGLVWLLLQVEAERDRQFEALTQMSTIISRRSADQEGAMIAEPEFHNTDPLAVSVSASRHRKNQVVVPTPPKSQPSMLMPADGQVPLPDMTAVFKIFDSDGDADLSLTEVQKGLRQLGQYLSKGQVQEMFLRLGAEGNNIQQPHFRKFLLDVKKYLPGKAWKISYTEKPPSLQVDLAFRYLYLFGVLLVTIIWLAYRWE